MASKYMELVMKIQAQIDKQLPSNIRQVAQEITKLNKEKKALDQAQKINKTHGKLKKEFGENIAQLRAQRNELRTLEQAKKSGISLSKKETEQYKTLTKSVKNLNKKIGTQKTAYQKSKMEIQKMKIPLADLDAQYKKNARSLENLNRQQRVNSRMGQLKTSIGNGAKKVGKAAVAGAVVGTIALSYGAVESARAYTDFNGQMKRVQAIANASAKDFEILEKSAMKFGATTSFTSIQSAQAMEKMALAGFSTKEILSGMPGVLNLAAASGEDLAMVSDIITDNLIPFNMTAKDTNRFADVLAYTMSKTNVDVNMLGESFKYASGGAGSLGVSLEETSSILGLMGDQAIKSGQAGRGLNATFTNLAKKSDSLKKIGINIKNSKGEFVGMTATVQQFEKKMATMGKVDQVAFLNDVLGKQGALAFGKLLTAQKTINGVAYTGAAAVEKMIEATTLDSVNASSKMRDIMLEGANGTRILFLSAVDGIKIAIGKKMLSEGVLLQVKKVTLYLSELANVINGTFSDEPANKFWQETLATAKNFINSFKEALAPGIEAIRYMFPGDGNFLSGFIKGLMDLVVIVTTVISTILQALAPFVRLITYIIGVVGVDNILVFVGAFMSVLGIIAIIPVITGIITTLTSLTAILGVVKAAMLAMGGPVVWIIAAFALLAFMVYKNWAKIKATFAKFPELIVFILGPIGLLGATIYRNWEAIKNWTSNLISTIVNFFMGLWEKIKEIFTKFPELFGLLLGPIGVLGVVIYKNWESIKNWTSNLVSTIVNFFFNCIENIKNFFMGLWEKAKEIFGKFPEILVFILGPLGLIIGLGVRIYRNWDLIKAKGLELKDNLVATFLGMAEGIKGAFSGITEFFSGVFTGISTKFSEIKEMIKLPSPPDWVMKIVGKGSATESAVGTASTVSQTTEPLVGINGSHRMGLRNVPFDGYIAELHKGERVLTAEENKGSLLNSISTAGNTSSTTINNSTEVAPQVPTLVFNPIINIQGNVDEGIMEKLNAKLEEMQNNFQKMLEEALYEKGRTTV